MWGKGGDNREWCTGSEYILFRKMHQEEDVMFWAGTSAGTRCGILGGSGLLSLLYPVERF